MVINQRQKNVIKYAAIIVALTLISIFIVHKGRAQNKPNVILIVLDAARADRFSSYGYDKPTTPFIDSIAKDGAIFLNHFSNGTYTPRSVSSMLFSRYLTNPAFGRRTRWGLIEEGPDTIFQEFDDQQILLPAALSLAGYKTVFFNNHGFFCREDELTKAFHEMHQVFKIWPADADLVCKVISWIKEHEKQRFFIYYHVMSPHVPYPQKAEDAIFLKIEDGIGAGVVKGKLYNKKDNSADLLSADELRILSGLYDSNLRHSDKWVGILYDWLKLKKLAKNTLIIITSDHGENLGEHNLIGHGMSPSDSLTHVPMIMVYPGAIPRGVKVKGMTESVDIMPTILDICGVKLPKGKSADGISLQRFINNPRCGKTAVFTNNSIRTTEYKYVQNNLKTGFFYDLKKDPHEEKNILKQRWAIKEKIAAEFKLFMAPYKKRYYHTMRNRQPDFPFFYGLGKFAINPAEAYETCDDGRFDSIVLRDAAPRKSWLYNRYWPQPALICLPSEKTSNITLSTSLPDGAYRISVLVMMPFDVLSLSKDEIGFQSRHNGQEGFVSPYNIEYIKSNMVAADVNTNYYYFDMGEAIVKSKEFSIEFALNPPEDKYYKIGHIKFTPVASADTDAGLYTDSENALDKHDALKSLGNL